MVHANAPLSQLGRLRLARCIVEDGWPIARAAERFQVSRTTATRWAQRYRCLGAAGMADRSSRPQTLHFDLPLSRTQMAEYLGLRIETVCRQIKRLRAAGIIETNNGRAITVHDMGKLERMAE